MLPSSFIFLLQLNPHQYSKFSVFASRNSLVELLGTLHKVSIYPLDRVYISFSQVDRQMSLSQDKLSELQPHLFISVYPISGLGSYDA